MFRNNDVLVYPDKVDEPLICDFVPVDDYDVQDFNRNDAGWIRNDISQLARAQSMSEYESLMRKLQVANKASSIPKNMTVQQAIDMIKPRYCQHITEISQFAEYSNTSFVDFMEKSKPAKPEQKVAPVASPAETPAES